MSDVVYVVMARDNFYNPDDDYILTATTDKKLADTYTQFFEINNPNGACSTIMFHDGLRIAEII